MAHVLGEATPEQMEAIAKLEPDLAQVFQANKIALSIRTKMVALGFVRMEDLAEMYRDRDHVDRQVPKDFAYATNQESTPEETEKERWINVRMARAWGTAQERVTTRTRTAA